MASRYRLEAYATLISSQLKPVCDLRNDIDGTIGWGAPRKETDYEDGISVSEGSSLCTASPAVGRKGWSLRLQLCGEQVAASLPKPFSSFPLSLTIKEADYD